MLKTFEKTNPITSESLERIPLNEVYEPFIEMSTSSENAIVIAQGIRPFGAFTFSNVVKFRVLRSRTLPCNYSRLLHANFTSGHRASLRGETPNQPLSNLNTSISLSVSSNNDDTEIAKWTDEGDQWPLTSDQRPLYSRVQSASR